MVDDDEERGCGAIADNAVGDRATCDEDELADVSRKSVPGRATTNARSSGCQGGPGRPQGAPPSVISHGSPADMGLSVRRCLRRRHLGSPAQMMIAPRRLGRRSTALVIPPEPDSAVARAPSTWTTFPRRDGRHAVRRAQSDPPPPPCRSTSRIFSCLHRRGRRILPFSNASRRAATVRSADSPRGYLLKWPVVQRRDGVRGSSGAAWRAWLAVWRAWR